jgi:O-antigen/teichoic acid export membrane protein
MLLIRRVQHRRQARIDLVTGISVAVFSILIAWFSRSIWALLVGSILTFVWSVIGLYLWKPFWTPRLAWNPPILTYLLRFGGRVLVNNLLDSSLDNVDNLWTGRYLGDVQLGYYSRAFRFAIYPRMLLSTPVNVVAIGTYAELKYDRRRLSEAFFRTNYFLIRAGFLLAGWLTVIAPEFIRLLIGERWLPMLPAFRLMLVFALLDPIKITIAGVLMAVGRPEKITLVRLSQFIALIAGLFLLGFSFQISGVALAMDFMITVGILLSLYFVRPYVDFSISRLLLVPVLSLLAGFIFLWLVFDNLPGMESDWLALLAKSILFVLGYLGILLPIEWKELYQSLGQIIDLRAIKVSIRSWRKVD